MAERLYDKLNKLLTYGNQKLESRGVTGDKTSIRGVIDGIDEIEGKDPDMELFYKGLISKYFSGLEEKTIIVPFNPENPIIGPYTFYNIRGGFIKKLIIPEGITAIEGNQYNGSYMTADEISYPSTLEYLTNNNSSLRCNYALFNGSLDQLIRSPYLKYMRYGVANNANRLLSYDGKYVYDKVVISGYNDINYSIDGVIDYTNNIVIIDIVDSDITLAGNTTAPVRIINMKGKSTASYITTNRFSSLNLIDLSEMDNDTLSAAFADDSMRIDFVPSNLEVRVNEEMYDEAAQYYSSIYEQGRLLMIPSNIDKTVLTGTWKFNPVIDDFSMFTVTPEIYEDENGNKTISKYISKRFDNIICACTAFSGDSLLDIYYSESIYNNKRVGYNGTIFCGRDMLRMLYYGQQYIYVQPYLNGYYYLNDSYKLTIKDTSNLSTEDYNILLEFMNKNAVKLEEYAPEE